MELSSSKSVLHFIFRALFLCEVQSNIVLIFIHYWFGFEHVSLNMLDVNVDAKELWMDLILEIKK